MNKTNNEVVNRASARSVKVFIVSNPNDYWILEARNRELLGLERKDDLYRGLVRKLADSYIELETAQTFAQQRSSEMEYQALFNLASSLAGYQSAGEWTTRRDLVRELETRSSQDASLQELTDKLRDVQKTAEISYR